MTAESKKKLYLHIGAPKCGSTSIQSMLTKEWEAFYRLGITVIGCDLHPYRGGPNDPGPNIRYESALAEAKANAGFNPLWFRDDLLASVAQDPSITAAILSSENLCHIGNAAKQARQLRAAMFRPLAEAFDVHPIIYIRRQDFWLEAAWNQWWMRTSQMGYWETILSQLTRGVPSYLDEIRDIETIFGKGRVQLRILDRKLLPGGSLIKDFLATISCDIAIDADVHANAAPARSVLSLLAANNHVFQGIHDNFFVDLLEEMNDTADERLLGERQRATIIHAFRAENEILCRSYLAGQEGLARQYFRLVDDTSVPAEKKDDDIAVVGHVLAKTEQRLRNVEHVLASLMQVVAGMKQSAADARRQVRRPRLAPRPKRPKPTS
jgi:hypothetical protein